MPSKSGNQKRNGTVTAGRDDEEYDDDDDDKYLSLLYLLSR